MGGCLPGPLWSLAEVHVGRIPESRDDTWNAVDNALRKGNRGLVKSCSLAQLLTKHRGVRNRAALPKLTAKQILRWADSFHHRTGGWPRQLSGLIADSPEDTWAAVDASLRLGLRGLAGGVRSPECWRSIVAFATTSTFPN
ncbi:MAG: hypothetical protein C0467_32590 [Planctomycetaceae bacterium]|nr:hypothetical protein [Planctomycetaceae bacterium]